MPFPHSLAEFLLSSVQPKRYVAHSAYSGSFARVGLSCREPEQVEPDISVALVEGLRLNDLPRSRNRLRLGHFASQC